jgi:hypothetical protein
VSSFLDQVTGFLGEHGQLDGHSSSPPKKCARSVSMSSNIQLSIFGSQAYSLNILDAIYVIVQFVKCLMLRC